MNHLKLRTEYSYRLAFGRLANVVEKCKLMGATSAGICDRNGTWGHVPWEKECNKQGIKPLFGVELAVVDDAIIREKQPPNYMSFIAKNNDGLEEIYRLVTKSTENFYYIPRLDYSDIKNLSPYDVILMIGKNPNWRELEQLKSIDNIYLDLCPTTPKQTIEKAKHLGIPVCLCGDNLYINFDDRDAYEVALGRFKDRRSVPMHIMTESELSTYIDEKEFEDAKLNSKDIANFCDVKLPKAEMVHFTPEKTLRQLCEERAPEKNIDLGDPVYKERLDRELSLIAEKNFEDYFYVIWDMLVFAKKHMLVGPARGSSCGSLVCYLLDITEIDPIPFGLIFERFIDVNRSDMPDIDIDFPDNKRDLVFNYLKEKYGDLNVVRLGSVNKFKAKSSIGITAKELDIPPWEVKDLKDSIVERSGGDARSEYCIMDTLNELEIGKKMIERYPHLRVAEKIEAHASHAGQHAAGMVVTAQPVSNYCSIDIQTGAAQIDKYDAETLDLLKIDALGLRTLTVIEDCLEQIGWNYEQILRYPITDQEAFKVVNDKKYAGIFQFEGFALKSVCEQMEIEDFSDIAAITALARPGPLSSGGTQTYLERKNGREPINYAHPFLENILSETYGVFVYQEQVMKVVREMGGLSWAETSAIRKAMSKSLGEEFFNQFRIKFVAGSNKLHNVEEKIAIEIFEEMCTFGSWGFNKSHAIAYGLVSYWCMVLKSKYPLEWAVACLRHAGTGDAGEDRCIKLLRELDKEGISYKPYDADKSLQDWSYSGKEVIGGLTNIKGIGKKVAADIIRRRGKGEELTPRQKKLLTEGKTPFDMLYEGKELFGHILDDPMSHNIVSQIWDLQSIKEDMEGDFLVMAKLVSKSLRDENELVNIEKRKTKAKERGEDIGDGLISGQTLYLNLRIEDDSGQLFFVRIGRMDYKKLGLPIVEKYNEGDWFLWKGRKPKGINMLFANRYRFLGNKTVGCVDR